MVKGIAGRNYVLGGAATQKSLKCMLNPFVPVGPKYKIPSGAIGSTAHSMQDITFKSCDRNVNAFCDGPMLLLYPGKEDHAIWFLPKITAQFYTHLVNGITIDDIQDKTNLWQPVRITYLHDKRWRIVSQGCRFKVQGPGNKISGYFTANRGRIIDKKFYLDLSGNCSMSDSLSNLWKYDFCLKPCDKIQFGFSNHKRGFDPMLDCILIAFTVERNAHVTVQMHFMKHLEWMVHGGAYKPDENPAANGDADQNDETDEAGEDAIMAADLPPNQDGGGVVVNPNPVVEQAPAAGAWNDYTYEDQIALGYMDVHLSGMDVLNEYGFEPIQFDLDGLRRVQAERIKSSLPGQLRRL